MKQYEETYPDAPKKIFEAFEKQVQHRIQTESKVIESNSKNEVRGQWFGFIITLVAIIGGFALIMLGKETHGLTSIIVSLTALATIFIVGRRKSKKELAKKADPHKP